MLPSMFLFLLQEREDLHLCLCLSLLLPSQDKNISQLFCSLGSFFTIFGISDVHRLKSSSCFFSVFYNKIDKPSLLITKTNCLEARHTNNVQYRTWGQVKWFSMYFPRLTELLSHKCVK